jgi:hypothetical protein
MTTDTASRRPVDWLEGRRLRAWELKEQGWPQRAIARALGVTGKPVEGLLQVIHEGLPLLVSDHQVRVRAAHGATAVLLGSAGGPAQHLRDQVLEARRRNAMVRFVDPRVGVQAGVGHDPVEVVNNGGDVVHAAQSIIERWLRRGLHVQSPSSSKP